MQLDKVIFLDFPTETLEAMGQEGADECRRLAMKLVNETIPQCTELLKSTATDGLWHTESQTLAKLPNAFKVRYSKGTAETLEAAVVRVRGKEWKRLREVSKKELNRMRRGFDAMLNETERRLSVVCGREVLVEEVNEAYALVRCLTYAHKPKLPNF